MLPLIMLPNSFFLLQKKYNQARSQCRGLHVCGALLAIGLVCVRALRKRNRRGSGHDGLPAPELSNKTEHIHDVTVSLDDWWNFACQLSVVLGTEPDVRVSHQPGQTMSIERSFLCSSKALMIFLFHPASQFWDKWQTDRGLLNLSIGAWSKHNDRQGPWQWTRTVNYIVPLKQFGGIGPSHAYTEETYTLIMASSSRWEASIIARTPCVPMGNCFQISLSMSSEDKPHGGCMMRVIGAVDFFKPMRLREFVIRRPALSGMRMTYAALMDLISQQALEYVPASVYGLPTIRTPVSSQVRRYPYSHELMSCVDLSDKDVWKFELVEVDLLSHAAALPDVPVSEPCDDPEVMVNTYTVGKQRCLIIRRACRMVRLR